MSESPEKLHDEIRRLNHAVEILRFRLRYIEMNISDSTAIRFAMIAHDWEIERAMQEAEKEEQV